MAFIAEQHVKLQRDIAEAKEPLPALVEADRLLLEASRLLSDRGQRRRSEFDFARLAAIIDCEGNIQIGRNRKSTSQIGITVANREDGLLKWCRTRFGGSVCPKDRVSRSPRHAPINRWVLTGAPKVGSLLKKCRHYFIIKKEQADIAIEFAENFAVRYYRLPDNVLEKRLDCMERLPALTRKGPKAQR